MIGGIYLHVPFCTAKCPYCDFYSQHGSEVDYDHYLTAMLRAINAFSGTFDADTIYFGGGTPVLLGTDRLIVLLDAVRRRFGGRQSEVTLEANPCAVDEVMLLRLAKGGFNRISFGVQSMNDATLRVLGRRHTAKRAAEMIWAASCAGFKHISADLMLAVPEQHIEEIDASVRALAALPIDHLSAYLLKIEPDTFFAKRYIDPDEDFSADCYLEMSRAARATALLSMKFLVSPRMRTHKANTTLNTGAANLTLASAPLRTLFTMAIAFISRAICPPFCRRKTLGTPLSTTGRGETRTNA